MSVVLPDPFGPSTAHRSPEGDLPVDVGEDPGRQPVEVDVHEAERQRMSDCPASSGAIGDRKWASGNGCGGPMRRPVSSLLPPG